MNKKKTVRISLLALAALLIILEVVAIVVARPKKAAGLEDNNPKTLTRIKAETDSLQKKIALAPKSPFIVIDSAHNTLVLKKGNKDLLQAVVSCGSGSIRRNPGGQTHLDL